ncbi:hypothetical protein AJOOGB_AJOOGB_04360, partial [Dysosmobacter welbionis]
VGIGGFQLGVLAILQHRPHDGGLVPELFQHIGVGGPAGLGLFAMGQAQLAEEDLPQLLGGVDVEFLPRHGVDLLFQLGAPPGQQIPESTEGLGVYPASGGLHLR